MVMRKISKKIPRAAESTPSYGEVRVKIADLKTHLSEYLRTVRAGGSLTILDRETPIAKVVPVAAERDRPRIKAAVERWKHTTFPKLGPMMADPVEVLLEMRRDKI